MPGNLEKYHPFFSQNRIIKWPGVGSHDGIHYLNGWIFEKKSFANGMKAFDIILK